MDTDLLAPAMDDRPAFLGTIAEPRPHGVEHGAAAATPTGWQWPPAQRGRVPIFQGLVRLITCEVIRQKRGTVYIPDILFAQVLWGAHPWPVNWRSSLKQKLKKYFCCINKAQPTRKHRLALQHECHSQCLLHLFPDTRHGDFEIQLAQPVLDPTTGTKTTERFFLGLLHIFGYTVEGDALFDFSRPHGASKAENTRI